MNVAQYGVALGVGGEELMRRGGKGLMSGLKLMLGVEWLQPGEGVAQVKRGTKEPGPIPFISVSGHLMRRALQSWGAVLLMVAFLCLLKF